MLSKKNKTNRLIFFTFTCLFFLLTFKITYAQIPCNDQVTCPSGCSCNIGTDPLKSYCYSDSDNSLCEYTTPSATNITTSNEESKITTKPPITFKPQITIPGSSFKEGASSTVTASTAFIGEYIKAIYNYLLAIVGLLAAIVLMISGIVWLTAAGNTERISQAKNWIMGSFTGLILALSSFLLLKLINPNLVNFQIQEIETVEPKVEKEVICCQYKPIDATDPAQLQILCVTKYVPEECPTYDNKNLIIYGQACLERYSLDSCIEAGTSNAPLEEW